MDNKKTILFVLIITFISSLSLSFLKIQLKDKQKFNENLDMKKNILKVVGIEIEELSSDSISSIYNKDFASYSIDMSKNQISRLRISDLEESIDNSTGTLTYFNNNIQYLPIYIYKPSSLYIIPISGKGLWSTLFGYFALESDMNTVKGITFYKHKETPGLGGEVDKDWFQDNFVGKKIFDNQGNLVSIKVKKGIIASNDYHSVDAISGATITGDGLTKFLNNDLNRYKKFLMKNMKK